MRIGVLGTGWAAERHTLGVLAHPQGELAVVANWRPDSLAAFAARHGGPRTTTDWRELAEDPDLDGVIVATPNALHAEQAIACLHAGKRVLVEKPMARTLAEAERMLEAAREAGGGLMVAHCWRFHDDVRALRQRVEAGELGTVVKTRGYSSHLGWGPAGWFTDPELAGGGALLDMGVHAIDTTRYLIGDPAPVRVHASIGTRYGDTAVDDDGELLITWDNGVTSLVECGWWQSHIEGLEADTELYGTEGHARVWGFVETAEGYVHPAQSMYAAQVAEFIAAFEEGRQARPDGEDGAVVMRVVDEAYRSAGLR
jgi:predicted dehydrogenase